MMPTTKTPVRCVALVDKAAPHEASAGGRRLFVTEVGTAATPAEHPVPLSVLLDSHQQVAKRFRADAEPPAGLAMVEEEPLTGALAAALRRLAMAALASSSRPF